MKIHPCKLCGACCTLFRVSFHWSETLDISFGVPAEFTESISPHKNAMMGTNQKKPKCVAFSGVVGKLNLCKIYSNRPSCCRSFKASYEEGVQELRCEEARSKKGLVGLTLQDWIN